MPVKTIHRRYVFFKIGASFTPKNLIDDFKRVYGIIDYSLSGLRIVEFFEDERIVIFSIGSRYLTKLIASATLLSIRDNMPIWLIGVSSTLKSGKKRFLKDLTCR
jgi:RNase P/RNase MRP subunit POP5